MTPLTTAEYVDLLRDIEEHGPRQPMQEKPPEPAPEAEPAPQSWRDRPPLF